MENQTLRDFFEDYNGFDYENGEIVIVDQRRAKQFIANYHGGVFKYAFFSADDAAKMLDRPVWSWTHTAQTMLIVI